MRDFLSNWYIQIDLSKFASLFLWWELALKTRESYDTSIRSYIKYTTMHSRRSSFSATISQIVDWMTSLRTRCHVISRQWLKIKSLISIRSSDLTVQSFLTRDFLVRISRINSTRIVVLLYTSWLHSLRARLTFFYHTIVHQFHSINSSQSMKAIVR